MNPLPGQEREGKFIIFVLHIKSVRKSFLHCIFLHLCRLGLICNREPPQISNRCEYHALQILQHDCESQQYGESIWSPDGRSCWPCKLALQHKEFPLVFWCANTAWAPYELKVLWPVYRAEQLLCFLSLIPCISFPLSPKLVPFDRDVLCFITCSQTSQIDRSFFFIFERVRWFVEMNSLRNTLTL